MSAVVVVYPSRILRAVGLVDEAPDLSEMPDGCIKVLMRIIKKINLADLTKPVFAARKTLASESGRSVASVNRALCWLEENGLVERERKARAGLRGSSSPVLVTTKLIKILQLDITETVHPTLVEPPRLQQPVAPTPAPAPGRSRHGDGFVRRHGRSVPADLAWLVDQGLQPSGLFSLMKMARAAGTGQRLADVVEVVGREYFEKLEGRTLYACLRAMLLTKGRDYAAVLARRAAKQEVKEQEEILAKQLKEVEGKRFHARDGSLIARVEFGLLFIKRDGVETCHQVKDKFWSMRKSGELVQVDTAAVDNFSAS